MLAYVSLKNVNDIFGKPGNIKSDWLNIHVEIKVKIKDDVP